MSTSSEKRPYYKISWFINKWVLCDGPDGCEIVHHAELGMDKPPPTSEQSKTSPTRKLTPKPATTFLDDIEKVASAYSRFKAWLDTPDPPRETRPSSPPKRKVEAVASFDIQEIPNTMRKLNMPVGAKLMERWFAGELNYSPDDDAEKAGLNQDGNPYPPSMIDKTIVSMKWVLGFERAKSRYEQLVKELIHNDAALRELRKILSRYPSRTELDATKMYGGNVELIHRNLHFQLAKVDGTLAQKFTQALNRAVTDRSVPDDLTAALGSFNFYAAIERASIGNSSATVSEISIYIKDNYSFNTQAGDASQYLGHWSAKGVIVVPLTQAATLLNFELASFPVQLGDHRVKGNVYYPVRNKDYRKWQHKHSRGGDFIIYSDRVILSLLLHPIEIRL